jgi:hypothetical protein
MDKSYILCLDTDHYAGNFERDVTAYATGVVGECEVGQEEATKFFAETDGVSDSILDEIDNKVTQTEDEHGCFRPCSIQYTPGWVNNGMGRAYRQSMDVPPTPEQIEEYRQCQRDYQLPHLEKAREYTAKGLYSWTPEGLEREEQKYRDIATNTPSWFGACYSVGIHLSEPFSEETLKFVLTRAKNYLTSRGIALEGVRLLTETTTTEETSLEIPHGA